MSIANFVKKICNNLGKNNKSTYSVVAIAAANGIFRPTFTMLKKDADPESKKYAALREGLTEAVAIPTYLICGELAAKCGEKLAEKAADKELKAMELNGKVLSDKAKEIFRNSKIKDSKASLMLIGVCLAAGLIIPALCSAVMNPVMARITKKNNKNTGLDIKENSFGNALPKQVLNTNNVNTFGNVKYPNLTSRPSGMKVGGV